MVWLVATASGLTVMMGKHPVWDVTYIHHHDSRGNLKQMPPIAITGSSTSLSFLHVHIALCQA